MKKIYTLILSALVSVILNAQTDFYYTFNDETDINVSNYPMGYYTAALVCDGQIVDAKTLIKQ